jgi:hypothetical protein
VAGADLLVTEPPRSRLFGMPGVPALAKDAKRIEFGMSCDVPAVMELRALVAQRGRLEQSAPSQERDGYIFGPAVADDRLIAVFVFVPKADGEAFVVVRSTPKPKADPPAEILAFQEKIGGVSGLATLVTEMTGGARPAIARYSCNFRLDATLWRGPVPRALDETFDTQALRLGKAQVEEIGYRFTESIGGLQEVSVTYVHDGRPSYSLRIVARGPVKVEEGFQLPVIVGACDLVLTQLFCGVEGGTDDHQRG